MDTTVAVRSRGITKVFGDVVALDHVDVERRAGSDPRLGRPERCWQDHAARPDAGSGRRRRGEPRDPRAPVGRALAAPDGVAGFVDGPGLYPRSPRSRTSPRWPRCAPRDAPNVGHRRGAGAGRAHRGRRRQGARLLPRHAAAAGPGRRAADQAAAAGARRAGQRAGPGGQEARARRPQPAGGRRRHGRAVQPPDGRPRGAVLRGHHPGDRPRGLLRPAEQACRREPRDSIPAAHPGPGRRARVALERPASASSKAPTPRCEQTPT